MAKNPARPILATLIALGGVALVASMIYVSSYYAIFGFALVFWGATLLYVVPPAKRAFIPSSKNIEKLLTERNLNGQGVYLPANKEAGANTVYIPANGSNTTKNISKRKHGVYISPPGQALCRLFEQQIGVSFTHVTLDEFCKVFPRILVDDLGCAQSAYVKTEEGIVRIWITGSILEHVCQHTNDQPHTHQQVGCLLTSAIACALTRVTGKPVTIHYEALEGESKIIQLQVLSQWGE